MKLWTTVLVNLLICLAGGNYAFGGPPPLDRPSPPPCCADGVCRPNPTTFGVYQTRWRRWPCEELQPTPAGASAVPGGTGVDRDVNPFETPRPEDEDRRAPPPTKKAVEEAAEDYQSKPTTPPAGPGGTGIPPGTGLPPLPGQPAPAGRGTEGPVTPPWETPPAPGGEGGPLSRPWDKKPEAAEPTGDADPPPAPPIAKSPINSSPDARPASRQKPAAQRVPTGPMQISSLSDPPPSLPLALSGGAYN